ncbi:hypothetical protein APS56_00130 [Pseudalgibacter alginicilyticus]|uniref:Uncharacterized protein n=1 Tax=Pseudalgibacter alginicilyticus TaxID=1736674 RepID=A0A0P0D7E5_9FLAO|nr:hypothetical protein [Pseudalgibacter alginicilyticus]ALJ03649.1 hypothetical protein APS56_00130 [Pseudalgibacter alginicilyticus]
MKNWNKIGKIKSLVIFILCVISISLLNLNGNAESKNDFYIEIIIVPFLFMVLGLPLITKFWNLMRFKFEKPNWNENPITF